MCSVVCTKLFLPFFLRRFSAQAISTQARTVSESFRAAERNSESLLHGRVSHTERPSLQTCAYRSRTPLLSTPSCTQYPAAPGAVSPSRRRLSKRSLNRDRSCLLLVVVLDRESCRSTRVQIRSHVVPLASESVNSVLNASSSSLRGLVDGEFDESNEPIERRSRQQRQGARTCSAQSPFPFWRCSLCKSCRWHSGPLRSCPPSCAPPPLPAWRCRLFVARASYCGDSRVQLSGQDRDRQAAARNRRGKHLKTTRACTDG